MIESSLNTISPIDGRYSKVTLPLSSYFSEAALIKYRVRIEVEYFIALCESGLSQLSEVTPSFFPKLREIYENFSDEDAIAVKQIEKTTNHDVKAVEYFLKEKMSDLGLSKSLEFIHFGLTSQDINNTSIPLLLKEALNNIYYPYLIEVIKSITGMAKEWKNIPMLAKTHGQPASPTSLGKEFYVFAERLEIQFERVKSIPFSAKFGGATGNFNAHYVAFPSVDWVKFANHFVGKKLELDRSQTTTQIEHYDNLAALCDGLKRINNILIDFNRDMWTYISMDYFKQKLKKGEVGSSAMPHKVNPIDFENSEGNLGIANAIYEHLSAKLPISRLQRDLTDSTVLRNIGVPVAHGLIALTSTLKGINKLLLNEDKIKADLENNWAVTAEAIQTILRREGYPKPYEALKALTRKNELITKASMELFIDELKISPEIKEELKQISPYNYIGINLVP